MDIGLTNARFPFIHATSEDHGFTRGRIGLLMRDVRPHRAYVRYHGLARGAPFMLPKKVIAYLEKNKAKYNVVEHRTVYTAWDLAQTLHEDPKNIVKSLVVKLQGKDPVLVLVLSHANLNVKKFTLTAKNWLKNPRIDRSRYTLFASTVSRIEFASEKWMREKIIGKVGATPAFAGVLKLPLFYDRQLTTRQWLILPGGSWTTSVKMKPKDFFALQEGCQGRFAAPKITKPKKIPEKK